jgi:hypothetical protein
MLYYEVEPWGLEADDYRAAMHNLVTASAAGAKNFDPFPLTVRAAVDSRRGRVEADGGGVEAKLDSLFGVAADEAQETVN